MTSSSVNGSGTSAGADAKGAGAAAASHPQSYRDLMAHMKRVDLIGSTAGLLGWDQETMMPPGGLAYRAEQLAALRGLAHEMGTDPRVGEWLAACEADGALTADRLSPEAVNLREIRRDYDRATKLPPSLVQELVRTTALAHEEWMQARKANDYARLKPWLAKIVELTRRKAECFGWPADGEAWDALAEGYEPGLRAKGVEQVFAPLRTRLSALIAELMDRGRAPDEGLYAIRPAQADMAKFVHFVAEGIGFDFGRGRLDVSAHPFCSCTHRDDVRMTTRYNDESPIEPLFSTMHETGHGIYDQWLPADFIGEPMGRPAGLSIHESQSRLWENFVGRSMGFWQWALPHMKRFLGSAAADLSLEQVYAGVNRVSPGLIRVESDEATYNLHIMIRFELERALLNGDLSVDDLPEAWNARYREDLGVDVPDDARGCMQDAHWPAGALGYFPTYTLGNLCAAQFYEAANAAMPDLESMFSRGEFAPLREWLSEHIHSEGARHEMGVLVEKVTGRALSSEPLMRRLETKLRAVYGLSSASPA